MRQCFFVALYCRDKLIFSKADWRFVHASRNYCGDNRSTKKFLLVVSWYTLSRLFHMRSVWRGEETGRAVWRIALENLKTPSIVQKILIVQWLETGWIEFEIFSMMLNEFWTCPWDETLEQMWAMLPPALGFDHSSSRTSVFLPPGLLLRARFSRRALAPSLHGPGIS